MRKIIGIIFVSLMFANIGFAEIRLIEKNYMPVGHGHDQNVRLAIFCGDGQKFIVVMDHKNQAISVDLKQIFEERDGKSLPAKC